MLRATTAGSGCSSGRRDRLRRGAAKPADGGARDRRPTGARRHDGGRADRATARRLPTRGRRDGPRGRGASGDERQSYALTVTAVDTTFATEDHFIAAVEMQLAGEPFAEAMGRDLGGYTRDYACQDAACQAQPLRRPELDRRRHRDRSSRLRVGRRVVRILEAADEQHRLRVGGRHVAAVRPGAEPDRRHRRGRAGARARPGSRTWAAAATPDALRDGRRGRAIRSAGPGSGRCCSRSPRGTRRSPPTNSAATCQLTSDDNPGRHARALLRRLRVRLHDAEPARSRRAGDEDDRARPVGLDRLERSALDAQLPAGHAQREGGARRHRLRQRDGSGRASPATASSGTSSRAPTSARATSRASRPATSSRSSTTRRRSGCSS